MTHSIFLILHSIVECWENYVLMVLIWFITAIYVLLSFCTVTWCHILLSEYPKSPFILVLILDRIPFTKCKLVIALLSITSYILSLLKSLDLFLIFTGQIFFHKITLIFISIELLDLELCCYCFTRFFKYLLVLRKKRIKSKLNVGKQYSTKIIKSKTKK